MFKRWLDKWHKCVHCRDLKKKQELLEQRLEGMSKVDEDLRRTIRELNRELRLR